jgi:hypothetical protein
MRKRVNENPSFSKIQLFFIKKDGKSKPHFPQENIFENGLYKI